MSDLDLLATGYSRFSNLSDFEEVTLDEDLVSSLNLSLSNLSDYNNWYRLDEDYYYFKYLNDAFILVNELIGEDLSTWMDLPTVSYQIVSDDDYNILGLISKNVKEKDKVYVDARSLSDEVRDYIYNVFMGTVECDEKFQRDLTYYVFRNYYAALQDRLCNSELIVNSDNSYQIAPIMDYASSCNNHLMVTYLDPLISLTFTKELLEEARLGNRFIDEAMSKMLEYNMMDALLRVEKKHTISIPYSIKQYLLQFDEYRRCYMKDQELISKNRTL